MIEDKKKILSEQFTVWLAALTTIHIVYIYLYYALCIIMDKLISPLVPNLLYNTNNLASLDWNIIDKYLSIMDTEWYTMSGRNTGITLKAILPIASLLDI